jgi:hypothetical protein
MNVVILGKGSVSASNMAMIGHSLNFVDGIELVRPSNDTALDEVPIKETMTCEGINFEFMFLDHDFCLFIKEYSRRIYHVPKRIGKEVSPYNSRERQTFIRNCC